MCFQVGLRTGKRGRPPKQPIDTQSDRQSVSESGAGSESSVVETVATGELSTDEAGVKVAEPEAGTEPDQTTAESTVDGEHTCSECGMSFQRRYSLIMHTLKHEKARGYKCSVSISVAQRVMFNDDDV